MKFKGDYHMHTTYSDGRGSIEEMVMAGLAAGLGEIGISEHGPRNIGTGVKNSGELLKVKEELRRLQPRYPEIKLWAGVEADVLNPAGLLDVNENIIKRLDYLIVGLHPYIRPRGWSGASWVAGNLAAGVMGFRKKQVRNQNTKALVEAVHRYDVWAISHPGLKMDIDISEVARACVVTDTAWEINTGHRFPSCAEVAEAFRLGVDLVVNSDAHFPDSVGFLEYGSWVLDKVGVPPERVRNAQV